MSDAYPALHGPDVGAPGRTRCADQTTDMILAVVLQPGRSWKWCAGSKQLLLRRSTLEGRDMTATFEHKVLKFGWGWKGFDYAAMERELNELGAQGWETVGTIVPSVGAGQSIEIGVVLKRTAG